MVLKTRIAWNDLPADLGCGCGKTCRHYLQLWHQAGVWTKLHALLLAELNGADKIDWRRALIDGSYVFARASYAVSEALHPPRHDIVGVPDTAADEIR